MLCFVLMSASLLLRKCLAAPSVDLSLLMHVFISVSSLSSVLIMVPRYLKL